jgi:hypothetical protein
MPTTDRGLWYPDASEPLTPLEDIFARMAESVDVPEGLGSGSALHRWRSLIRAATGTINNVTYTTITGSWVNATGAPTNTDSEIQFASGVFTVARDGPYLINGSVLFAANATGSRRVKLLLNGVTDLAIGTVGGVSGDPVAPSVHWEGPLAAGDTVTFQVYQSSGGSLALASNAGFTFYTIHYTGPI